MELKRFIITSKSTGDNAATVYADRFEPYDMLGGTPCTVSCDGEVIVDTNYCGSFFIGNQIIAQADLRRHQVGDSGGRLQNVSFADITAHQASDSGGRLQIK
jgi:hypothetical protein